MKKIKKVLYVCSVYKPNIGGVETTIENLTNNLHSLGIEASVLTKKYPFDLNEYERIGKCGVCRFSRPKYEREYLGSIDFLNKYENELKADIIHDIGARRPMPLYALLLARKWKVPCLITFTGGDLPDPKRQETLQVWDEGLGTVPNSIKQFDKLTSFSKSLSNLAKKTLSMSSEIEIVYAGVDLNEIEAAPGANVKEPYFFAARRLDSSKGIDILIKAFSRVKPHIGETKLLIGGSGIEEKPLQKLSKELGLIGKVVFLGKLTQGEVFSYMKSAIAHICPSRAEGGGIVNFEAQAAGCLSIGSNVGGIPEYIINGKTGFLFESENVDGLSRLLLLAIKDKDVVNKIKRNAKKNIEKYSWKEFTNNYIDIYNRLMRKPSGNSLAIWSSLIENMWNKLNNG